MKPMTPADMQDAIALLARRQDRLIRSVAQLELRLDETAQQLHAAKRIIARYKVLDVARGINPPAVDEAAIVGKALEGVASITGISPEQILSPDRRKAVCQARWMVMGMARDAGLSVAAIGRALAMDHTTVMHGLRRLESK